MLKFIVKKIFMMLPMMFLISVLVFVALSISPMDPVNYLVSPDMASNTENIEALREQLGLNDFIVIRYFRWLKELLSGEFGYSIVEGNPIREILALKIPATFELALFALILSTIVGMGLGILSAVHQNSIIDNVCRFFSVLGTSIPQFFFGIILLNIFALKLNLLPIGGRMSSEDVTFFARFKYLILPGVTMSIPLISSLMKYTRNSMLDVFHKDYVKTARAKGISEWKVYTKHVLRNALGPVLVLLIFRLPMLIGGSVIIETVFSWPGIGGIIVSSVSSGDYPVIMITTLMVSFAILLASLLVDVMAALLDPRIRL